MENSGKTILIIEDEDHQREALRAGFERQQYRVLAAMNGKEGMEKIKESRPNIILLDLMMPVLDGFSFLEALKSDEALKNIPVMILTNLEAQERLKTLIDPERDCFFTKTNNSLKDIIGKTAEICSKGKC